MYYTSSYQEQINRIYFVDETTLSALTSSNYPTEFDKFGLFNNDVIEFSIFNSNNDVLYNSILDYTGSSTSMTREYLNSNNQIISYSFDYFTSNIFVVNGTYQQLSSSASEIVLSPVTDIQTAGFSNGIYSISYDFLRNVVGSIDNPVLKIKQISNSNTELKIVPTFSTSSTSYSAVEYDSFINDKVILKFISKLTLDYLKDFNASLEYYKNNTSSLNSEIKFNYSFKSDTDEVVFIDTMFNDISSYFENFIFENYTSAYSFDELKSIFQNFCETTVTKNLTKIRTRLTEEYQSNFNSYVNFFVQIYLNSFDFDSFKSDYYTTNSKYLNYVLNFGSGSNNLYPILNYVVSNEIDQATNQPILYVKLLNELDNSIINGQTLYISKIMSPSCYFKTNIFTPQNNFNLNTLRGPDFSIKFQSEGNSTKQVSMDDLTFNTSNITQTLVNLFNQPFATNNINIDFTDLSNFVKFSSARQRVDNFKYKLNLLNSYNSKISELNNLSQNLYSLPEITNLQNSVNDILINFTSYETFLYNNSDYVTIHDDLADVYDKENVDSLVNNIPEHILMDSDNFEYLLFLNMIGEHFDVLYSYINKFPRIETCENLAERGISDGMVIQMLEFLGWNVESGSDDQDLSLSYLGTDKHGNRIDSIASNNRTRTIWRRILNNLSYIYKTKGTSESIRALFKCYGIPDTLFKIQEYGGIEYNTSVNQDSLFIFDNIGYLLNFKNNNEYLKTNWTNEINSLEFKFCVNSSINTNNDIFTLFVKNDDWSIGIKRDSINTDLGSVFFTLKGDTYQSIQSDVFPIFNGEVFSVLLRRNLPDQNLGVSYNQNCSDLDFNILPIQYDLVVAKSDEQNGGLSLYSKSSMIVSRSFNDNFNNSGNVYIGNYYTTSETIYSGCIDYIRYWKNQLSDDRFASHTNFNGSFDIDNPFDLVNDLKLRIDFSDPNDLSLPQNYNIKNLAFNNSFQEYITAYNFRNLDTISSSLNTNTSDINCEPEIITVNTIVSASFPFQFKKLETSDAVKLPNFGSNKLRSNKIRFETQTALAPLSFNSRSTVKSRDRSPVDSNKLGVFFSPVDLINDDILKFFGSFDMADYIGNPSDLSNYQYSSFEQFKKIFYEHYSHKSINFQDYINYIRSFVDRSLFEHIKNLVPARTTLITGLTIEPSLLERPKIALRAPVIISNRNINAIVQNSKIKLNNSVAYPKRTGIIEILKKDNINYNINYDFCKDYDQYSRAVYADNGISVVSVFDYTDNIWKFQKCFVEKVVYPIKRTVNGVTFTLNQEIVDIIPVYNNPKYVPVNPLHGYSQKHLRNKRNFFNKKAIQTSNTTINSTTGYLDGSDVVVITKVDRGSIIVSQQSGGNILQTV